MKNISKLIFLATTFLLCQDRALTKACAETDQKIQKTNAMLKVFLSQNPRQIFRARQRPRFTKEETDQAVLDLAQKHAPDCSNEGLASFQKKNKNITRKKMKDFFYSACLNQKMIGALINLQKNGHDLSQHKEVMAQMMKIADNAASAANAQENSKQ